jgi:hypothetical protein
VAGVPFYFPFFMIPNFDRPRYFSTCKSRVVLLSGFRRCPPKGDEQRTNGLKAKYKSRENSRVLSTPITRDPYVVPQCFIAISAGTKLYPSMVMLESSQYPGQDALVTSSAVFVWARLKRQNDWEGTMYISPSTLRNQVNCGANLKSERP